MIRSLLIVVTFQSPVSTHPSDDEAEGGRPARNSDDRDSVSRREQTPNILRQNLSRRSPRRSPERLVDDSTRPEAAVRDNETSEVSTTTRPVCPCLKVDIVNTFTAAILCGLFLTFTFPWAFIFNARWSRNHDRRKTGGFSTQLPPSPGSEKSHQPAARACRQVFFEVSVSDKRQRRLPQH